jgi:hypothetical protein
MALSTIPTLLVSLRAERNLFSANFYRKVFVAPTEADKTQSKRQNASSSLFSGSKIPQYERNVKLPRDHARQRQRIPRHAQGDSPRQLTVWRSRARRDNLPRQETPINTAS